MRPGARRRRARRQAGRARLQRPGHRRAVEVAVVDLQPVPPGRRLFDAAHQPVSERHHQRRHLARIPGRRLRDRSAHRGDDVRRRRAVVADAAAAHLADGRQHDDAARADPSRLRQHQRHRRALPDLRDEPRPDLARLHPLHRRRRGARRGPDHAVAHAADDRLVGARRLEGIWRVRRRRHSRAPSATCR